VGAVVELLAEARADVLALMAFAAGTLPDREAAVLAEIIPPWILVIAAAALVEDKRPAVDVAFVRRALRPHAARRAAGEIAVAPIVERLRIGEGRRVLHRKAQLRKDGEAGVTGHVGLEPRARDQRARRIIGEGGVDLVRPLRHRGFGGRRGFRRTA